MNSIRSDCVPLAGGGISGRTPTRKNPSYCFAQKKRHDPVLDRIMPCTDTPALFRRRLPGPVCYPQKAASKLYTQS